MNKEPAKKPIVYRTEDLLACGKFSKHELDFLKVLLTNDCYSLAQVKTLIEAEMERVID